jgi:hypothetical protein
VLWRLTPLAAVPKHKRVSRHLNKNIQLLPALVNWRLKLPQRILWVGRLAL